MQDKLDICSIGILKMDKIGHKISDLDPIFRDSFNNKRDQISPDFVIRIYAEFKLLNFKNQF